MAQTKRPDQKSRIRSWLHFLREKRKKLEEETKKEHRELLGQTSDGVLEATI